MSRPKSNEDLAAIVRSGRSRPLRKWLIIAASVLLLGCGAYLYFFQDQAGPEKPEYVTQPVKLGRISLVVTAAGNLAPTNQVIIGSELSGTVQEVYVDTNDLVKKEQPIAKLDTTKLNQQTERSRAALLAAKARVGQAIATLDESKAALARQEELHQLSGGKTPSRATMETSRATVSRAVADLESAQAAVAGAEAEVRSFERDLGKAVIRSPVDGVVLSRTIEVGQTVAASFTAPTLFTIAEDLKKMELVVAVTEADIGRVEAGQTATFSVDAWPSRHYTATVKKVAFGAANTGNANGGNNNNSAATTGVVTYSTELEVANDDLSLRPGMTATVDIAIVDKKDIIVVPNSALRFDPEAAAAIGKPDQTKRTLVQSLSPGGGRRWRGTPPPKPGSTDHEPRVWTLKDGEPVEIPVTPGITDGRVTEITGDALKPDTPVIVSISGHSRMTAEALIELSGLTKTYGSGDAAFMALAGVDLTIHRGEFVAVMGPSGSGKSTLMNLLGCLDSPTSGSYRFKGIEVETLNKDQRSLIRRHALGFIFQGFNLLARTSALENVELPLLYRGYSRKQRHRMAREALASVGLPDKERNTPSELSGGQQQRVAIARAIVTNPDTLFADEPTGNLDSKTTREIMELLRHLNSDRGISIIMVTHEDEVATYARRIIHVRDGLISDDRLRQKKEDAPI